MSEKATMQNKSEEKDNYNNVKLTHSKQESTFAPKINKQLSLRQNNNASNKSLVIEARTIIKVKSEHTLEDNRLSDHDNNLSQQKTDNNMVNKLNESHSEHEAGRLMENQSNSQSNENKKNNSQNEENTYQEGNSEKQVEILQNQEDDDDYGNDDFEESHANEDNNSEEKLANINVKPNQDEKESNEDDNDGYDDEEFDEDNTLKKSSPSIAKHQSIAEQEDEDYEQEIENTHEDKSIIEKTPENYVESSFDRKLKKFQQNLDAINFGNYEKMINDYDKISQPDDSQINVSMNELSKDIKNKKKKVEETEEDNYSEEFD